MILRHRFTLIFGLLASMLLIAACAAGDDEAGQDVGTSPEEPAAAQEAYQLQQAVASIFNVTTTSLKETGFLQSEFTCEGTDSSPYIAWDDVPSDTESIAVVAEDLDLAGEVASHWVLWGLPPDTRELSEGASGSSALPAGGMEGVNTYGEPGYKGPCPPPKVISGSTSCPPTGFDSSPYLWTVYAIGKDVSLGQGATRDNLLQAIDGSILASGSLDVKYISKTLINSSVGCAGDDQGALAID